MSTQPMTIKRTIKAGSVGGKGFVMLGFIPGTEPPPPTILGVRQDYGACAKWFERYFPTVEKAEAYAAKRGWAIEREGC